jgi:hypothetical protein
LAKELIEAVVGAGRAPAVLVFQNYDPGRDNPQQYEKDAKKIWHLITSCLPGGTIVALQELIQKGELLDLEEIDEESA